MKNKAKLFFLFARSLLIFLFFSMTTPLYCDYVVVVSNGHVVLRTYPFTEAPVISIYPEEEEEEEEEDDDDDPDTPKPPVVTPAVDASIYAALEALTPLIEEIINQNSQEGIPGETDQSVSDISQSLNQTDITGLGNQNDASKTKNQKKLQNETDKSKESKIGDPVQIASGNYELEETDINNGRGLAVQITRRYSSGYQIISSFGQGWFTNLDQRIIRGNYSQAQESVNTIKNHIKNLESAISKMQALIISTYDTTSPEEAKNDLINKIYRCNTNFTYIQDIYGILMNLESAASGYGIESRVKYNRVQMENLSVDVENKIAQLQIVSARLDRDLEFLQALKEKKAEAQKALVKAEEILAAYKSVKEKNKKVMFDGMDAFYEETGFNTINFIDQAGSPHLMFEDPGQEGIYKTEEISNYVECAKNDGGFLLKEIDGTQKYFDTNGFLVQIKDRNSNSIFITRNDQGKALLVQSSCREKYELKYEGNFIKEIRNLHSPDEVVSYCYQGNFLHSVTDIDGDILIMNYDNDGYMTELQKSDGSTVTVAYGLVSSEGKKLATSTTDEEGFSEYFDFNKMITSYTDHDGYQTTYQYDDRHRTKKICKADGSIIEYHYDSDGNLKSLDENGMIINYNYDLRGNKISASYQDGSAEYWTYDNYNQLASYTDQDGIFYEYIRDNRGNLTEYRIGNTRVFSQIPDQTGRSKSRTIYRSLPVTTYYDYDPVKNIESQICGDVKTTYEYDKRNRLKKVSVNDRCISEYEYQGKEIIRTDYNGLKTRYISNSRKDLISIIQQDTVTGIIHKTRIEYDKRHLPVKIFAGDGEQEILISTFLYTGEGKLKSEEYQANENFKTDYEYKNEDLYSIKKLHGDSSFIQVFDYAIQKKNEKLMTLTDELGNQTSYLFDSRQKLKQITDATNETMDKLYSSAGRLKGQENSYGGWNDYLYNSMGQVKEAGERGADSVKIQYNPDGSIYQTKDCYGRVSTYSYDSQGNISGIQTDNQKIWYDYDYLGRMTKQAVGKSSSKEDAIYYITYEYSPDGRKIFTTRGGKYKSISELDAFGNVIKETDGNGNSRLYEYDFQNFLIAEYDAYGNKKSYEYNSLGKIKTETLPDGSGTFYEYNALGLPVKIYDDCGILYTAEYDKAGRLVKEKNRAEAEQTYEYDKADRVKKIYSGGQLIQAFEYLNKGKKVIVQDAGGDQYFYNYDLFGRLISEKNRLGLEQDFVYDKGGKLSLQKNFDGSMTTISYSEDQTVRTIEYSDKSQARFIYDAIGNLIEIQNENGHTRFEYDKAGLLIKQKELTSGEEIFFDYDMAGNRIALYSSNRESHYTYGKNGELKEFFDNKQRVSVQLDYNKNGKEILRKFGNGTAEESLYDKAGRIIAKTLKSDRSELLWAEAYLYGEDGKRTASVNDKGFVTLFEYNQQGQLSAVYYPYSEELINKLKEEAEENGLASNKNPGENKYLTPATKEKLSGLLNSIQYSLAYNIKNLQLFIKESYSYDKKGNRSSKTTDFGTITYSYDKENRLLSSGSGGQAFVNYTYDKMGNLLTEESSLRCKRYVYNSQNRFIYCELIDKANKEISQTYYAYDALGRRIIVQDKGEAALRSLYDGLSFEVIKQSPVFAGNLFTDSYETGIHYQTSVSPNGDRYRYISDDLPDNMERYFYLDQDSYKKSRSRYLGERNQITINGRLTAQTSSQECLFFTTDLSGSVRTTTDSSGYTLDNYSYDAFGNLIQGKLTGSSDFGYLGKQQDPTALLYNYGYRDYSPQQARFTTLDPIRDGPNWYTYCNSDPVNFVDLWGLELTLTVNKDTQMMTVEINTPNFKKRIDVPVTTHVISDSNQEVSDKSSNSDTTRKQKTGDKQTNPTQFPNGTFPITSVAAVPKEYGGIYGNGWLTTNVTQNLPATDGSGFVPDSGYYIHYTGYSNTNGCIGVKNLYDMEEILQLYDYNRNYGDGKTTITVKGGKKNK